VRIFAPWWVAPTLLATSAIALTPPLPVCEGRAMVAAEQRALRLTADDWHGYDPAEIAPGWVIYSHATYTDSGPDVETLVLESCAAGVRLVAEIRFDPNAIDAGYAVSDAVHAAVRGAADGGNPQTYSLDQIAALARAAGAETQVGNSPYRSCACAWLAGEVG
jgi:hypothetical protein